MNISKKKLGAAFLTVLTAGAVGVGLYAGDYYPAGEEAAAALVSVENVAVVEENGRIVFAPKQIEAGFIFYPGGKVEYTAYAPLLRELAEEGVLCVLTKMPLNLAVLNMDAAEGIPERFPEVEDWYIGGHSLGGAMAASYAAQNPEEFEGLVLLAAYSTEDLRETELTVLSLYGSADGVLDLEKYQEYHANFPESTVEAVLEGGCHACFGSYGPQAGDGIHTLTREEQTALTAAYILETIRAD